VVYGYCSSAKAQVKVISQKSAGLLEIICIEGGLVSQVEAEEMGSIIRQAKKDARLSDIKCRFKLTEMSYYDFLDQFDCGMVHPPHSPPACRSICFTKGPCAR
jgi:hypothetical protein